MLSVLSSVWQVICWQPLLHQVKKDHMNLCSVPALLEKVRAAKQQRRRAEGQWLKTGLTIHKQIYNCTKKCVTRLVDVTKTSYFCSMIRGSLSCKQLFRITNQLLGSKKTSPLPTVFPLIELPQRFLEFFYRKVQTVRNNLDCLASLPPSCSESCFHGWPLRNFEPVNKDFVKQTILNSAAKTCDLDAFPIHLLL